MKATWEFGFFPGWEKRPVAGRLPIGYANCHAEQGFQRFRQLRCILGSTPVAPTPEDIVVHPVPAVTTLPSSESAKLPVGVDYGLYFLDGKSAQPPQP
jgi:hypothetical protein